MEAAGLSFLTRLTALLVFRDWSSNRSVLGSLVVVAAGRLNRQAQCGSSSSAVVLGLVLLCALLPFRHGTERKWMKRAFPREKK